MVSRGLRRTSQRYGIEGFKENITALWHWGVQGGSFIGTIRQFSLDITHRVWTFQSGHYIFEILLNQTKSDCIYHAPINLETNGRPWFGCVHIKFARSWLTSPVTFIPTYTGSIFTPTYNRLGSLYIQVNRYRFSLSLNRIWSSPSAQNVWVIIV